MKGSSVALLSANKNELCIFNLHDNGNSDILVDNVPIWTGQMLAISSNGNKPGELKFATQIARRQNQDLKLPGNNGFIGEFSIMSALSEINSAKELRKINGFSAVLKNAAIQQVLGLNRGGFSALK